MSLTTSYVVSLQTNKTSGTTAGDKSVDSSNSIKQAINNIFATGTSFNFDLELFKDEVVTIDFPTLGVDRLRLLLLKSDNQFGYRVGQTGATGANSAPPLVLARTAFVDFSVTPPTTFTTAAYPNYITPNSILVTSPAATHPVATTGNASPVILVQVIGVSYT